MSGVRVVACKQALITLLKTRQDPGEGLEGVQVTYGWPGDDKAERERIFTGRSSGDTPQTALKAGRRFRNETSTFDVVIQVEKVGGTPEEAADRAVALGVVVEECVADEKYLGGVAGLNWALVTSWTLNDLYNDRGSLAELVYTITYNARLT